MTVLLPRAGAPLTEGGGPPTREHYRWCQIVTDAVNSGQLSGTTAQEAIAAIATALGSPDGTVENIPPQDESDAAFISGSGSLNVFGTLAEGRVQLSLTGDVQTPGASYVYGTDADGERTWRYAPIESLVAGANITIDDTDPAFPIISAGGGDPVISQDTAPAFPSDYPFWWDSANLQMFYQYDDGTSVQWVEVGVAGGGGSTWTTVKKTADESRASTTTLANDAALNFPCAAGTRYRVRFGVIYTIANATMDFKVAMNYTGTLTGADTTVRRSISPAAAIGSDNEFTVGNGSIIGAPVAMTTSSSGIGTMEYEVIFLTNAAGTFSLQWAQNTSDAGAATVLAGSYLEYMRC